MATPSKTPKTPTKGGDPSAPQPSVQEGCFFLSILNNIQNKPEIDWPKVAMEAGFKNAETAKVRFGQIKRKFGVTTPTASKATPRKRAIGDPVPFSSEKKRKTSAVNNETDEGQMLGMRAMQKEIAEAADPKTAPAAKATNHDAGAGHGDGEI